MEIGDQVQGSMDADGFQQVQSKSKRKMKQQKHVIGIYITRSRPSRTQSSQ